MYLYFAQYLRLFACFYHLAAKVNHHGELRRYAEYTLNLLLMYHLETLVSVTLGNALCIADPI